MLLEEIILRLNKYKNIDLYFHREITYILPFIWAGYNVEARYSYVIEDLSNIESVQSNMDTKVRNIIKNAYMSENLIVYANRYRSTSSEVMKCLNKAEIMFYKGKYEGSVKLVLDLLDKEEPGFKNKFTKELG